MAEYLGKLDAHRPLDANALKADEVLAAAMVRWIEIVGEAAANVSDATRDRYSDVPWTDIVAMRNRLIHAYPDVNLDLVWGVIADDGPRLLVAISAAIRDAAADRE
jgi:uncharacterized protein with HEPN domain